MKREEAIEIAEKSQIDRMPSDYNCRVPYWLALDDELQAAFNEVERRTIEKCAQACNGIINKHSLSSKAYTAVAECQVLIRSIQQQEKQQ